VWGALQKGEYTLCVSNEILDEYEEIISMKTNSLIASNVIQTIINGPNVDLIDPHFQFYLVKEDVDDNKFVDCAIVANATFIVSNDKHFNSLKDCDFPKIDVKRIEEFSKMLHSTSSF
jgi:putative PIN family toxin of toxin-antitoxin system